VGDLSLQQFLVEVRAGLGNRVDTNLTDQRIIAALNMGQQRMSRFYSFKELRQTLTTQGIITGNYAVDKWLALPPGTKVIHSLVLQDEGNSRKLIEKPWRQFDANVPLPEYIAPQWPRYYTRFGNDAAMLFPIPLSAYVYFVRATILPTPFTYGSGPTGATYAQTSDFVEKDDIIVSLGIAYFMRLHGRPDLAKDDEAYGMERLLEAKNGDLDMPDMDISKDDMTGVDTGITEGPYWQQPFVPGSP
jgi:hypothetical protein